MMGREKERKKRELKKRFGTKKESKSEKGPSWKKILGILGSIIAFLITFYLANRFFTISMWSEFQAPQWILTLGIPLGIAWLISVMTGEKLITTRKAAITATICLLAVGVWTAQPWQTPEEITGTGEGGEGEGGAGVNPTASFTYSIDNQNPLKVQFNGESIDPDGDISTHSWSFGDGSSSSSVNPTHTYDEGGTYKVELEVTDSQGNSDTYSMSITIQKVPQGYALFKYAASFEYLSSDDNKPIEDEIFMIFPSPNIDNEPVVSAENFAWRLIAHYEENGEDIRQVQIDNGLSGEFILPRKTAPGYLSPFIKNTSHGPKVWLQTCVGWYEPAQDYVENAMYQNEIYRIQGKFLVPENQADKVTLVNDQGKVWIAMHGYTGDDTKIVNGKARVKFLKWTDTHFETIFKNSETEWELSPNEWQGYRLND